MNKDISIFMFIDAMGWEIIKDREFLNDILPNRYRVQMQFGYSCTAIPTILTGKYPVEHKHLSFYYYSPDNSPFKILRLMLLHLFPTKLSGHWRIRHNLSKILKKFYGYTGYFEMYAMPFNRIHYFDYIEKTDLFVTGGLLPVKNLADTLEEYKVPYHISNWRLSEKENVNRLIEDIEKEEIRFAFLYTADMDALLHRVTKDGKEVPVKLKWYEDQIKRVLDSAHKHYEKVNIHIMSDHGMTTLISSIDVKKSVESLGLKFGRDYAAVYDSTMARFWFLNDNARQKITECIETIENTTLVSCEDKKRYGIDFHDNMYGEEILLLDPGYQIAPSDMGLKALPGMHGYSPEDKDSYACFLSSEEQKTPPKWVGNFFDIMKEKIIKISSEGI